MRFTANALPNVFTVLAALLMLSLADPAGGQSIVAVMPLRAAGGVSQSDADTATNLLETGLVKSGVLHVVERKDISQVLAAQEYSHGEYMDENLALRIGGLLSAEQIVFGSLAKVGSKYFVTARIIDVSTARTLRAESLEASAVDDAVSRAESLGLRLAGLRVDETGRVETVRFCELMISTAPEGAVITVNGIDRGLSPALVEKVPLGPVVITAKRENLYGERLLEIDQEGSHRIEISLNQRLGRLFVRAPDHGAVVKLDGEELGFLGTGLFPDITEGDHLVELVGTGLYAQTRVSVPADGTVTVEIEPVPVGAIQYRLPDGATATITVDGLEKTLVGEGGIEHVIVGSYSVHTTQADYEADTSVIIVQQARTTELAPELRPTAEHRARIELAAREQRKGELLQEHERLDSERRLATERRRKLRTASTVVYGVSGGLLAAAGAVIVVDFVDENSDYPWLHLGGGLGLTAAIGAVVGTMLWLEQPQLDEIDSQLEQLDLKVAELSAPAD